MADPQHLEKLSLKDISVCQCFQLFNFQSIPRSVISLSPEMFLRLTGYTKEKYLEKSCYVMNIFFHPTIAGKPNWINLHI